MGAARGVYPTDSRLPANIPPGGAADVNPQTHLYMCLYVSAATRTIIVSGEPKSQSQ
jgi:hypothetical protein